MIEFHKGDRVCAVLVCNKWQVDFSCFCGRLVRIEKNEFVNKAVIRVTTYFTLYEKQKHKPTEYVLDIDLFKLLPWNEENRKKVRELRLASRTLNRMTFFLKRIY